MIPPCADRARREELEADDAAWQLYYFGQKSGMAKPFWYDFTAQQLAMQAAFRRAVYEGGDQSIAGSRGEGKTINLIRQIIKFTVEGKLPFSVLGAATGPMAKNSLEIIKNSFEVNRLLAEDYPEVCVPIRALENTPSRAHFQTVSGVRHDTGEPFEMQSSRFRWCGDSIILPNVPGSPAAAAIIATRGLDAAVRGLNILGRRPTLFAIDDPDTARTARNSLQAEGLERRIESDIGGLGEQQCPVARIMVTTLQSRKSVSYKFTDPTQKPSWHPIRFRFLVKPPKRTELWDDFVVKLKEDWLAGTTTAHDLYVENREAMDEGAEVGNPHRHTAKELSALEHYYGLVARLGAEAVATEYDNDPPAEQGPQESGITEQLVRSRLNKWPRGKFPPGTLAITGFIDIGDHLLHWVVIAWTAGATGFIIDYGAEEVHSAGKDSPGIDRAIVNALHRLRDTLLRAKYTDDKGRDRPIDLMPIDSGYRDVAVHQFIREVGGPPFIASKGDGQGKLYQNPFRPPSKDTPGRKLLGHHWYKSKLQKKNVWLLHMDADYWKRFCHERFLTPTFNEDLSIRRGSLSLWGEDPKEHPKLPKHIAAEVEKEEFLPGKGVCRVFHRTNPQNHWLDAVYGACVAADVSGVSLFAAPPAAAMVSTAPTSWFAEQARRAKEQRRFRPRRAG